MSKGRARNNFLVSVFGFLMATGVLAQGVKIGGENADVFFAVTGGNKNVHLVPAQPTNPGLGGQIAIPSGFTSEIKHYSTARIFYRRNNCTHRKEVVIAPPGMTAEQIQQEEKSRGQDCGAFALISQDVSWQSGTDINIDYSGDVPMVSAGLVPQSSASHPSMSAKGAGIQFQLRGFGGASFINWNTPPTAGFDGAVLFPLGSRILVGPTAGFGWVRSTMVHGIGSMSPGSTFINTTAGFKNGNFGGVVQFPIGGFQLGLRAGATVAGSSITQQSGFCGTGGPTAPAGCTVFSTTTMHDKVVGPFVGGYISHSICRHVGLFAEYDYTRLKDTSASGTPGSSSSAPGTIFDVHSNTLIGGLTLTFGWHY